MNLSFLAWLKFQPLYGLYGSLGNHACKAISQSAVAPSSGEDNRQTASYWAFHYIEQAASSLASHLRVVSSGCRASGYNWLLAPMITRMQDASMSMNSMNIKSPLTIAECEHIKEVRSPARVGARASPLEQQQRVLQQQDFNNYQFPPPLRRVNSREWARQYKGERIDKINFNNVFGPLDSENNNEIPVLSDPNQETQQHAPQKVESSSELSRLLHSPLSSSSSEEMSVDSDDGLTQSPTPSIVQSSDKSSGPSPVDVICGRGGKANTHEGNIFFREEAKKLRSWYESSSKSEKFTISAMLVDLVRERGGRFLKRDSKQAGNWLEADANDVRKKASQALREGRKHQ